MKLHNIQKVPVNEIKTFLGRERNRNEFSQVVENIKKIGLKIPITVRPIRSKKKKGGGIYKYEVIKGHGRLLAVQKLGWSTIPAFVADKVDECELVKLFLMENEVRRSLTAAERALLMEQDFKKDVPVSELARKYGFKENTVYSYLAILETISPKIGSLLSANKISLDTAKTIGSALDKDEQESLASTIAKEPSRANIEYMANAMREQKEKNRIKVTRDVLKRRVQDSRVELEDKKKELSSLNEEWVDVVGGIRTLLQDMTYVRKLNRYSIDYSKFVRMT